MAPLLAVVLLLAAAPNTDARIAASAAAAQALQGPLDGTWTLAEARGRALYVFQIVDPVSGGANLQAAWRAPGQDGALGQATARRVGDRLSLQLGARGPLVSLRRLSNDLWRGALRQDGRSRHVLLRRG
ncbi:MAG TPA: hypothetical protein VIB82_05680 [Caulobacteraceae bacterium]|jgi:hypothetical protein